MDVGAGVPIDVERAMVYEGYVEVNRRKKYIRKIRYVKESMAENIHLKLYIKVTTT